MSTDTIVQQDSMMSLHRQPLSSWCHRVVIKIGSAVLSDGKEFDHVCFENLVRGVSALRESGIEVTVVCSGAVALGMTKLSLQRRPLRLVIYKPLRLLVKLNWLLGGIAR